MLNTKRNKRWNGDVAKLSADYLNSVVEKMQSYGNKVQFSSNGTVNGPNFLVSNDAGKQIAFSGSAMLIQLTDDDFSDESAVKAYTLDQIKSLLVKPASSSAKSSTTRTKRAPGAPRGAAALAKIREQIAIQKYDYYKANRATLPPDIREHSEKISEMMEAGMSAEDAFSEAIKFCFEPLE